MRLSRRIVLVALAGIVVAGIAAGGVFLVNRKRARLSAAPRVGASPIPVRTSRVRRGDLEETRRYLGFVEPVRRATVAARVTANVIAVLCDESDRVEAGDVLARLDSRQYEESLAGIEAQIGQGRADLAANAATRRALTASAAYWEREAARQRTLVGDGAIPETEAEATADRAAEVKGKLEAALEESRGLSHRIESIRHSREEAATILGYATITSPFAGVVSERLVDPGDLAAPGKTLFVVEDRSGLRLSFDIPQADLSLVAMGMAVRFTVAGTVRETTLSLLYPSLDRALMLRAEADLGARERDGLTPGAAVSLRISVRSWKDFPLLPASSVIESPGGSPFVFAIHDNRLVAKPVQLLARDADTVAVEGVDPGERVVRHTFLGWARLSSGLRVEAIE